MNEIALRVAQLRTKKGVSARDMNLSMGQNLGYITNIESGHSKPSIDGLIFICEYLGISLCDFFDPESQNPEKINGIISDLKNSTTVNSILFPHRSKRFLISNKQNRSNGAVFPYLLLFHSSLFTKKQGFALFLL